MPQPKASISFRRLKYLSLSSLNFLIIRFPCVIIKLLYFDTEQILSENKHFTFVADTKKQI